MQDRSCVKRLWRNIHLLPLRPKLLARVAGNYYKMLVLGKPCLRVLTFALTYQCQLFCRHCLTQKPGDSQDKNQRLSLQQIKTVLAQAEKCGVVNIHLTGGEPLLFPDLYAAASLVDTGRNILSIATNGILLARESRNLKKAGFDLVIVSIDSPLPEAHDQIRGYAGAHEKAWQGVEAARKEGLKIVLSMVVTRKNLHNGELAKQIDLCRKEKFVLQLLPARKLGAWSNEREMLLTSEDLEEFYRIASPGDVRWDGCSSYFSPRCLAGRERLYVDPAGEVYPCDFIPDSFGNIKNEPLAAIWEKILKTPPYDRPNTRCLSSLTG
jgi:MoaA/NifB/PqqE/SkfB family radical SAM enzyme